MPVENVITAKNILQLEEKTYFDFDAAVDNVELARNTENNTLNLKVNDSQLEVSRVTSAFPLSAYLKRIVFFGTDGEEIGCLKNAGKLRDDSLDILQDELEKSYFMPVIEAVEEISDYMELELWKVQTNKGRRSFEVRQPRRNIRVINPKTMMVKDVDGNRYAIKNWRMMDRRSLSFLMRHL